MNQELNKFYAKVGVAISKKKRAVVNAMNSSGIKTSQAESNVAIANKIADNLFKNDALVRKLSLLIDGYSNTEGDDAKPTVSVGGGGGIWGQIATSAVSLIGGALGNSANAQQIAAEQEAARQEIIRNALKTKRDPLPFIIVGGVLLLGGVVVVMSLKK